MQDYATIVPLGMAPDGNTPHARLRLSGGRCDKPLSFRRSRSAARRGQILADPGGPTGETWLSLVFQAASAVLACLTVFLTVFPPVLRRFRRFAIVSGRFRPLAAVGRDQGDGRGGRQAPSRRNNGPSV